MARLSARPLLEDMRAYAAEAMEYLGDRTVDAIVHDRMRLLALTRAAEIVGEAASRVPKAVQDSLPDVSFRRAISMRHRLVHGYGSVDPAILADTIRGDFPTLIAALSAALKGVLDDETA